MLKDEIGTDFTIESIAFMRGVTQSNSEAIDLSVYFALSELDQLTEVYENNYISGTQKQVLFIDTLELDGPQGSWIVLELDEPFYFSNDHNLVIETSSPNGQCYAAVYGCITSSYRSLIGFYSGDEGDLYTEIPHMMLEGSQSLENSTFGAIKIILGRL